MKKVDYFFVYGKGKIATISSEIFKYLVTIKIGSLFGYPENVTKEVFRRLRNIGI